MFQSLRPNSTIYVLHKDGVPRIQKGAVVSVTASPKQPYQIPMMGIPSPELVDLVARFGDETMTFEKLPATAGIADFGGNGNTMEHLVISDNREAMSSEVTSIKQRNIEALNSVDFYRSVIEGCDSILVDLNPDFAEKQAQQAEINNLKTQMDELMRMNKELIAEVKGLRTSSKSKKEE